MSETLPLPVPERVPQQRDQRFRPAGRSFQAQSVLEQGLARAFPLSADGLFDDLLIAIDLAEEPMGLNALEAPVANEAQRTNLKVNLG